MIDLIKKHEGSNKVKGRHIPYQDSVGVLTIGYGHNLEEGISEAAAEFILKEDLQAAIKYAEELPYYYGLTENRKSVIVNMLFNLGPVRFKGFRKFDIAMNNHEYKTAADEMLDSLWAKQVKGRAVELAEMMRYG